MFARTLSLAAVVALTGGIASAATATSAQAATTCSIPASSIAITATDLTSPNTAVQGWDAFKVSYTLRNLDGLAAGSCITFTNPAVLREIPSSTIDLKAADGSLIGTQSITDGVVTITLTTDYAQTHQNVTTWGSYSARIDDTIATSSTVPLAFTVNGTVTSTQDIVTGTCIDCTAMPVGFVDKYGAESGGKGDIYVNAPVVPVAGTKVTLTDTLTSPGQAFTGQVTASGYTMRNQWGAMSDLVDLPVVQNADGTWTATTSRPNEAIRFTIPMTFTGSGPWTDTATVEVDGTKLSDSAVIKSYEVQGAGDGTQPVVPPTTPVVPANPVVPTVPAKPTTPDVPVKPQGNPAPATRAYVAQVDTYGWKGSAWYGNKIAAFDDDAKLGYREDGFLWMSKAAKAYSSYGHRFVTFTAPVNATPAQLAVAYNKVAPVSARIATTAKLGKVTSKTGTVTDVWVLGKGATAAAAWGPKHTIDQVFIGRR